MLLVGNHSGGNMTPDTFIFTLAFSTFFGVERRFYQLAHNLVLAMPAARSLRKYGTIAASHENARRRSTWAPRCSSIPAATRRCTAPRGSRRRSTSPGARVHPARDRARTFRSCPLVSIGGQETALFLSRGERLARLLRLDRLFRLKVLPISLALPWGLNIGDMLATSRCPRRSRSR